ncbi:hypothetical protein Shyhy02_43220 [Streptomyces hygroscopicus subsp. hygroscopicus]|nr:hypothetical protein Shyhy02_43220 [Streptomyces hygroscopicus subsp. hygroscopicus]
MWGDGAGDEPAELGQLLGEHDPFVCLQRGPFGAELVAVGHDLRACSSEALSNDTGDTYTEEKFLQVKALLDRFKDRADHTRVDAGWTARVTDVRRWFVFSASELDLGTDDEHEVHTDSSGKSGGQKEKLAYTVLAASLAYQFRIDPTTAKAKTFHFVTIGEAFGRGDDSSAHFALDLFQRLGLQLLVITLLQKLHVIEPHVTRVGYVDKPDAGCRRWRSPSRRKAPWGFSRTIFPTGGR